MSIAVITSILIALSSLLGLPIAIWTLHRKGREKAIELHEHLLTIGVQAFLVPEHAYMPLLRDEKNTFWRRSVGMIQIKNRHMAYIRVIGTAQQYNVSYGLEFLVAGSFPTLEKGRKLKMKINKGKGTGPGGKDAGVKWQGKGPLAERLNTDDKLNTILAQVFPASGLEVLSAESTQYVKIKTGYFKPDASMFDVLDRLAGRLKS